MRKENLKWVEKKWGEEIILVNSDKYCGKLLIIDRGAKGSYHYHKEKEETFMAIEGYARLVVEGQEYLLAPFTKPKTIEPGEKHSIEGISEAVILEVSTPHNDNDVFRETESQCGIIKTMGG